MNSTNIPFIDAETSAKIDAHLMNTFLYSIDQLMEIAGLSVAEIIAKKIIAADKLCSSKILSIVGPGNNGGDALVATRYLKEFGVKNIEVLYPKKNNKELFNRLITQMNAYEVPLVEEEVLNKLGEYDFIIDGIFGFSFKGNIREPFNKIISLLKGVENKVISIDIPSGWDVNQGNINGLFEPQYLISLTLPKLGAKNYKGQHYLGGRFVPEKLYNDFGIKVENGIYNNSLEMFIKI